MKTLQLIKPAILFIYTIACVNKKDNGPENTNTVKDSAMAITVVATDTFETGKVITNIVCKGNPAQSYALYIPVKGNRDSLPVIYFFDPHSNGALPLTKYKALADRYNFILIGSNNSKNGNDWASTENIWNTLSFDSKKRLPINVNRVYTCGFSGGAKVAGYIALNHPEIRSVIVGGAALPDETIPGNFRFSITAIAGEGDMNMTDLVAFNTALNKTQTRHRIIFFDGKHEWCPENTMNLAFAGLQLDAMREKLIQQDDTFINNYITASKKRISDYLAANNYIKAESECRLSISLLDGLTGGIKEFDQKDAAIKGNAAYQKQWKDRLELLTTEQKTKALYQEQFQQADMNYWTATIHDLQAKANPKTAEGAMHQRLLAYLSLAFYSISNQLITNQRDKEARYFVDLYKLDDATNPEAWYFSAILNARSNNANAAKNDLLKAVENGFMDKNRMEHQPEFRNVQVNLTEIESKMK